MSSGEPLVTERAQAQNVAEIEFAKKTLNAIQAQSIEENREYCGYIGLSADGNFIATPPKKGRKASCFVKTIPDDITILASYHTHGGYSYDHDSELPSPDDIKADSEEGTDGYISTPGGRVWFTNTETGMATLLCGEACVISDPDYKADPTLPIKSSYQFSELIDPA